MFTETLNAMPRAFVGMLGHSGDNEIESKICTESTGIAFGKVVSFSDGTGEKVRLPTTGDTAQYFAGIAKHQNKVPNADGTVKWNLKDVVSVVTEGSVFVISSTDFTVTDPVYVRITANSGANEDVGNVGKSTDSGKTVAWTRARFKNSGSAGDLAEINIDLP